MSYDVSGIWDIVQSNGYKVKVNITQQRDFNGNPDDGDLSGFASEFTPRGTDISDQILRGKLTGNTFEIVVDWQNGTIGQYSGTFDPIGTLSGVTFDINHPGAQATWSRQP